MFQDQAVHRASETNSTEDVQPIEPSTDVRLLMDKTASYMSRNGRHLESAVQSKGIHHIHLNSFLTSVKKIFCAIFNKATRVLFFSTRNMRFMAIISRNYPCTAACI